MALLLLASAVGAHATPLISCPGGTAGDWSTCGFYIPSYPGISLDAVTLRLSAPSSGTYSVRLTARSTAYNGVLLGTANVSGQALTSGAYVPVTFAFPSVRLTPGSRICFILSVSSGPATYVYFHEGTCSDVIITDDTTPPLSTWRHNGVDISVLGAQSLQVTNGWSIQAAIDAAASGETVTVGPGTYTESIVLKSGVNVIGAGYDQTLLRGSGTNDVVRAHDVTNCRLSGFQITGSGTNSYYRGIYLNNCAVVVDNNLIQGNTNGIGINSGTPIIRNNIIKGNGMDKGAYGTFGITVQFAAALVANNLIISNRQTGIWVYHTNSTAAQIINNTIVGNSEEGIWCDYAASAILKNNIVVGNGIAGIQATDPGTVPRPSYNDVYGNGSQNYRATGGAVLNAGVGDISANPLFEAPAVMLFTLGAGSPALHAGDPDPIYNNPDGTRNNMGAFGGPGAMSPAAFTGLTSGFVFTSVGLVPTAVIRQSGSLSGLANIPSDVAAALYLPSWRDAPFGGGLYLNGLFGFSDSAARYYQIWAAPWQGGVAPALTNFQPVLDPLSKYKYTILTNGTVQMSLINVGPNANGLYLRTDLPDSGYWTSPDLKLVLNSYRLANGKWDFICKAYTNDDTTAVTTLTSNQLSRITLWIDNNPVSVNLASVRDQFGTTISECGIIHLATTNDNLQFEVSAYHPSGFLDSFSVGAYYGRNHYGGAITNDQYVGVHEATPTSWYGIGPGTQIVNSQPAQLLGRLEPWQTCAYQFTVYAVARTINGFNRIYDAWFNDHYYLTVGTALPSCVADLNSDRRIDGVDLALFAARYGLTNCATAPIAPPAPQK